MARVALVSGAAGGFGTAIVKRLRDDGLVVASADLPALDVTDQASVERMVARVLADHSSRDVLVNSAGVAGAGATETARRDCAPSVTSTSLRSRGSAHRPPGRA